MLNEQQIWIRLEKITNPKYNNYTIIENRPFTFQEVVTLLQVLEIDLAPNRVFAFIRKRASEQRPTINGELTPYM